MFTLPEIEKALQTYSQKPMTPGNLQMFNQLAEAMKHMSHMNRTFTEEDAKEWAKSMNPPARWTFDQTTAVLKQRGYHHNACEFYAVMNSLASDYGKTMAKYGMDRPDVWAELAHDWLDDIDAEEGKAGRYWRDIVRHD